MKDDKHSRNTPTPGTRGDWTPMLLASRKLAARSQYQSNSLGKFWPKGLPSARVGLSCLVLLVLRCFGALNRKKKSWPEEFFLPPAACAISFHAKVNLHALAWWNVWPLALFWMAASEKAFRGPKVFFPTNAFLNVIRPKELSSPGMLKCLALSSVLDGCSWKTCRGCQRFFQPTLFWPPKKTCGYPR